MENFHQPLFPSTTTTMTSIYEPMSSSPSNLASSSSLHYYYPAFQYLPPNKGGGVLHFPNPYPYYQPKASQPPFLYPMYPVLLPRPQPNPVLFPRPQPNPVSLDQGGIESKAARIERRMARQRRHFLSRSTANSGSSSCSTQMDISSAGSDMQNKDLYFRMPDKKVAAWFISNLSFTSFFYYIPYICFLILFSLFWTGIESVVQEGVEEEWRWILGQDCHSKGEVFTNFFPFSQWKSQQ